MPDPKDHLYRVIDNTALPYVTYGNPISTDPEFIDGSTNILTSAKGFAERRPGFSAFENTPTTFTGTIERLFCWRRWNGDTYWMACETTATSSKVYKLKVGTDNSFALLHTAQLDTAVTNPTGASQSGALPTVWVADTASFTSNDTYAFVSLDEANTNSNGLNVYGFGFSSVIPSTATILAVTVEVERKKTDSAGTGNVQDWHVYMVTSADTAAVVVSGAADKAAVGNWPTTDTHIQYKWTGADLGSLTTANVRSTGFGFQMYVTSTPVGGAPRTTLAQIDHIRMTVTYTDTSGEPFDFVVSSDYLFFGNGTDMRKWNATTVTKWGITAPADTPTTTTSGTGITAVTGWKYVYCYSSSTTGHLSGPSPSSASTGAVANKTVNVYTVASMDTQVNEIRIFRSTDGGDGIFFEITGSPFTNTSGTKADTTADTSLGLSTAPVGGINDPPPGAYGFVLFANRIWMIEKATSRVWFTGWEEISDGFPEECVPSGNAGNYWAMDSEAIGLSLAADGVLIATGGKMAKISGDSLDTFYRETVSENNGLRERATIARLGKGTSWLDSVSNSIWVTDSYTAQEISVPIRPDIASINHAQAAMSFYVNKQFRWLVLMDGGASRLRIYDLDRNVWIPPWTVAARAIAMGETTSGSWDLLLSLNGTKVVKLDTSLYTDDGTAQSGTANTNLFDMVTDAQPGRTFEPEYYSLETGTVEPTTVKHLLDDEPSVGTYTDITANKVAGPLRSQGATILENWYYARKPAGRRCALQINWAAANTQFILYSFYIATRPLGGR